MRLRHEEEDRENKKKYFLIRDPAEREKFLASTMSTRRWEVNSLKAKRIAEDLYRKSKRFVFPYRPPEEEEEEDEKKSSICNKINCALFKSYSGRRRGRKSRRKNSRSRKYKRHH